jgi:hypothetical protein
VCPLRNFLIIQLLLFQQSCVPHNPEYFSKIAAPQIHTIKFAPYNDPNGNFIESVCLQWENTLDDESRIQYYTLIRKLPSDSLFDVFSLSQRIPPSVKEFNDPMEFEFFPTDGFDTIQYRMYAVDIYGRPSDSSVVCTLLIAPQPKLNTFNYKTGCVQWESWIRGGQISYGSFWSDTLKCRWSSKRTEAFPRTDEPAVFTFCKPDSCIIKPGVYLYYVLYIEATDARSIKAGKLRIEQ